MLSPQSSLNVRRAGLPLLVSLGKGWNLHLILPALASTLIGLAWAPQTVVAPQALASFPVQSPVAAGFAVIWSLLISATVPEPMPSLPTVLTWRRRYLSQVRVIILTAAVIGVAGLLAPPLVVSVALLALAGEAVLAAAVLGFRYAWVLPLVHAAGASTLGANAFGDIRPWAWFLRLDPQPSDFAMSLALYVIGLIASARARAS